MIDTVFVDVSQKSHFEIFFNHFHTQGINEVKSLAFPYDFWAHCYRTETGLKKAGEWKRRRGSRALATLLRTPSSLKELFVMVNKETFEGELRGKTEVFWTVFRGIGGGFYDARKTALKHHGEGSSVLPVISLAWNFDMIRDGKAIELPEC